jgi:transposase
MRFGVRSEALTAEQRDLFQETWASDIAAAEAELARQAAQVTTEPTLPRAPRPRAGCQPLPEHLPRIEHRHEPESCTCGQCGNDLTKIGEDISEQLDVEPARFFVHRHIRPQYTCRACETVSAAPIPPAVIDGGLAAVGLYVWVLIGKYLDHMPLYRLEQIAARGNVILSRSTMAQWVGRIGVALQPLADRLTELLRERSMLHADETPVAQLDPGKGKTHRAYLWAYRSNVLETGPPIVVFDYQTSRAGRHAQEFLAGWRGHLMVDDFSGYKALFAEGVTELGCLAHYLECSFIRSKARWQQCSCGLSHVRTPHKIGFLTATARTRACRAWASMSSRSPARCRPSSRKPAWPLASSAGWS